MAIDPKKVERPKFLEPTITGKRVKTLFYGIKQTSDYVRDAENYMDALAAENAEMKKLLRDIHDYPGLKRTIGSTNTVRLMALLGEEK